MVYLYKGIAFSDPTWMNFANTTWKYWATKEHMIYDGQIYMDRVGLWGPLGNGIGVSFEAVKRFYNFIVIDSVPILLYWKPLFLYLCGAGNQTQSYTFCTHFPLPFWKVELCVAHVWLYARHMMGASSLLGTLTTNSYFLGLVHGREWVNIVGMDFQMLNSHLKL